MSLFSDNRYCWRETYFILCHPERRPKLASVEKGLAKLFPGLRIRDSQADANGHLEMRSVISLEDNAVLDIDYQAGESITQETMSLLEQFQYETQTTQSLEQIDRAREFEARLELLHFEQVEPRHPNDPDVPPTIRPVPGSQIPAHLAPGSQSPVPSPPSPTKKRFAFDPNAKNPELPDYSYKSLAGANDAQTDDENDPDETSDRLAPDTLILAIELLVAKTGGMALDPSSGFFL